MNVLVTGGAGYVGNLLASALLERGHCVTILDNFMFGYEPVLHITCQPNLRIIKQDIRNKDASYLANQDVIFHLAAISGYPACEANPNSAQLINVNATQQMINALSKDQMVIYASTTSLYGTDTEGSTSDEKAAVHPATLYGETKYEAEKIVMDSGNAISLRWATIYGVSPRMRAGLMVNDFVDKAVNEKAVVLFKPHAKRTFMHIADAVNGYIFALDNSDKMRGEVFNMGTEKLNLSKRQLADAIREHVDFEIIESRIDDKDKRDFYVSFAKARALGYACEKDLSTGLAELVKLYQFYTPNSFIKPI